MLPREPSEARATDKQCAVLRPTDTTARGPKNSSAKKRISGGRKPCSFEPSSVAGRLPLRLSNLPQLLIRKTCLIRYSFHKRTNLDCGQKTAVPLSRRATRFPAQRRRRGPDHSSPSPASCAGRRRCRSEARFRPSGQSETRPVPAWHCRAKRGRSTSGWRSTSGLAVSSEKPW